MPLLAPFSAPPTSPLSPTISASKVSSVEIMKSSSVTLPLPTITTSHQTNETATTTGRIPVVQLNVDLVSDTMAARLSTSLLGHVLFLKNQIPFPVIQLARIPGVNSNTRATKMRNELLASFDTLASHLNTTFTALSTAFRLCNSKKKSKIGREDNMLASVQDIHKMQKSRAYLAIILGPSIGTAKSRIIFAVDGLEAKQWGVRDDETTLEETDEDSDSEEQVDSDSEEEEENESDYDGDDVSDSSASESEGESDRKSDQAEESSTPLPSPVRPSLDSISAIPSTATAVSSSISSSRSTPSRNSYAEEQKALRTADHLLSRTLAAADGDGRGMACELAPTQTHILIRAPRRFAHPAWIPRQNVSASLEGVLREFLEESGIRVGDGEKEKKGVRRKGKRGAKTEGVWVVGSRSRLMGRDENENENEDEDEDGDEEFDAGDGDEKDEMIWWSWDGKIVGLQDW